MASGRDIRAGRAYVELGVDDKLAAGLRAAQQTLKRFGAEVTAAGLKMTALGGAATGGLFLAAKSFADVGDSLDEMSARTGITVERLSQMQYAAKLAGVESEAMEVTIRKMQKTLVEAAGGSKEAADSLAMLGLSASELRGMSPDEQYRAIGDAISRISEPAQRAAAAMAIFGKSGAAILPMFQDGAAGFDAMNRQAEEFALTLSTQDSKAAARFADSLDLLTATTSRLSNAIGSALAPLLTDLAMGFNELVAQGIRWTNANRQIVVYAGVAAAGVTALGAAITGLGLSLSVAGVVAGGLATAVTAIGAAFAAAVSPIGLTTIALGAGVSALLYYSGAGGNAIRWLMDRFAELSAFTGRVFGGIRDAIQAGDITLAADILWAAIRVAFTTGTAQVSAIWDSWTGGILATWSGIWTQAQSAFTDFSDSVHAMIDDIKNTWSGFTGWIQGVWTGAVENIKGASEEIRSMLTGLEQFKGPAPTTGSASSGPDAIDEMFRRQQASANYVNLWELMASKLGMSILSDEDLNLAAGMPNTPFGPGSTQGMLPTEEFQRAAEDLVESIMTVEDQVTQATDGGGLVGPPVPTAVEQAQAQLESLLRQAAEARAKASRELVAGSRPQPLGELADLAAGAVAKIATAGSFAGGLAGQIAGFSASSTPAQLRDIGNKLDTLTRQAAGISQQIGGLVA